MTTKNFEIPQTAAPKTAAKTRKRTAKKDTPSPSASPSHQEIARLAEKYWAERGWPQGSPEEDWLRAEQELRGKAS
jgi:Protein of unknown function (DUF2934)